MISLEISSEPGWGEEAALAELSRKAVESALDVAGYARLIQSDCPISISIRFTTNEEVHQLNRQWRDKDKPTNILSFPMLEEDELTALADGAGGMNPAPETLLGDMILAGEICHAEAQDKGWPIADYTMHLLVHGSLHLLGHDHIDDDEAQIMEALERKALANLGLPDPYR